MSLSDSESIVEQRLRHVSIASFVRDRFGGRLGRLEILFGWMGRGPKSTRASLLCEKFCTIMDVNHKGIMHFGEFLLARDVLW
jgi:hypothetical protein